MKPKHFFLRNQYAKLLDPQLTAGTPVLQLGGGKGSVSVLLKEYRTRIIEINPRYVEKLKNFGEVLVTDIRRTMPSPDQFVVGNIPFECTAQVLKNLYTGRPLGALLVVQKEVADKLTSRYGLLAAKLFVHFTLERVVEIPPEGFVPHSKASTIVRFTRRSAPLDLDLKRLQHAFTHMRKCVPGSSLRPAGLSQETFMKLFSRVPAETE